MIVVIRVGIFLPRGYSSLYTAEPLRRGVGIVLNNIACSHNIYWWIGVGITASLTITDNVFDIVTCKFAVIGVL